MYIQNFSLRWRKNNVNYIQIEIGAIKFNECEKKIETYKSYKIYVFTHREAFKWKPEEK